MTFLKLSILNLLLSFCYKYFIAFFLVFSTKSYFLLISYFLMFWLMVYLILLFYCFFLLILMLMVALCFIFRVFIFLMVYLIIDTIVIIDVLKFVTLNHFHSVFLICVRFQHHWKFCETV